jgi:hypothetical protein
MDLTAAVAGWLQHTLNEPLENPNESIYEIEAPDGLQITLDIPEQGMVFYLQTVLAELPELDAETFYYKLLCFNLHMQETRGAALAIDEINRKVVLNYTVAADKMDTVSFGNTLGGFIEAARHVSGLVSNSGVNFEFCRSTHNR